MWLHALLYVDGDGYHPGLDFKSVSSFYRKRIRFLCSCVKHPENRFLVNVYVAKLVTNVLMCIDCNIVHFITRNTIWF